MSLIACVPNVSEGSDETVILRLSESIDSIRGIKLLNVAADSEQNRTVFTFIGRQAALRRAVIELVEKATEYIDVSKHRGRHPRMGAVDVIPFVPLLGTQMEKAVNLARLVGKDIAERFSIPTYLYGEAALVEERRSVSYIREGEFEGFSQKILKPEWKPDFGQRVVHPTAGVSGVGARPPLVAFNVLLKTRDEALAQTIVDTAVDRHLGRRFVRTLVVKPQQNEKIKIAVTVKNYKDVTIFQAVEAFKKEAKKRSVEFLGIELVGLVTGDALFACLEHYLGLVGFNPLQILEFHIPKHHIE